MSETKNGKESWKSSIETARDHFDQAFRELAKAAEQAQSQGRDVWESAQNRVRETWEDVRSKGTSAWDEGRDRGEELVNQSRRYAARNPSKVLGISVLAGLLLGVLAASLVSSEDED